MNVCVVNLFFNYNSYCWVISDTYHERVWLLKKKQQQLPPGVLLQKVILDILWLPNLYLLIQKFLKNNPKNHNFKFIKVFSLQLVKKKKIGSYIGVYFLNFWWITNIFFTTRRWDLFNLCFIPVKRLIVSTTFQLQC